jgi:hypothetical protein
MHRLHPSLVFLVSMLLVVAENAAAQPAHSLTKFDSATDWASFPKLFKPFDARPGRAVAHGPKGLTFTLAPRKQKGPVGMEAGVTLTGNFQIEVKYNLEVFPDKVEEGYGVYLGISVVAADNRVGRASINRGVYANAGHQYAAGRDVPAPKGIVYARSRAPASSREGRLALRRVGSEAIALVADGPGEELLVIKRYPFTEEPMRTFTLFTDTGGAAVQVRARLHDLQVRTGADVTNTTRQGATATTIVPMPGEAQSTTSADPSETAPFSPLRGIRAQPNWWLGCGGLLIGLVVGICVGRWWRRAAEAEQRGEKQSQPAPARGRIQQPGGRGSGGRPSTGE